MYKVNIGVCLVTRSNILYTKQFLLLTNFFHKSINLCKFSVLHLRVKKIYVNLCHLLSSDHSILLYMFLFTHPDKRVKCTSADGLGH